MYTVMESIHLLEDDFNRSTMQALKDLPQASYEKAEKHYQAKKVTHLSSKSIEPRASSAFSKSIFPPEVCCECCNFPFKGEGAPPFALRNTDKLAELGLAFPLHFFLIKFEIGLLLMVTIVASVGNMIYLWSVDTPDDAFIDYLTVQSRVDTYPKGLLALHCAAVCGLMLGYCGLSFLMKEYTKHLGNLLNTSSNLAVQLENLGPSWEEAELKSCLREDQVHEIIPSYHMSSYLAVMNSYDHLKSKWADFQNRELNRKWWYRLLTFQCWVCTVSSADLDKAIDKLQTEVRQLPASSPAKGRVAIVIFKTPKGAKSFRSQHKQKCCCCPGTLKIGGRHISVTAAPEPNDLIWQNLQYTWNSRILRRLATSIVFLVLLIGARILLGYLAYWESELDSGSSNVFSAFAVRLMYPAGTYFLSLGLDFLARWMSSWERHYSYTGETLSVAQKLVTMQFLISVLFPVFIYWSYILDPDETSERELASNVLIMLVLGCIVKPFVKVLPFFKAVIRFFRKTIMKIRLKTEMKYITREQAHAVYEPEKEYITREQAHAVYKPEKEYITREQAHAVYEPPEVDLAIWYSDLLTKLLLTLAFTPLIPVVAPIAAVGLGVDYWLRKYVLLRLAARPKPQGKLLAMRMMQITKLAALSYSVGIAVTLDFLVGLLVTAVVLLSFVITRPCRSIISNCCQKRVENFVKWIFREGSEESLYLYVFLT